jgi:hypothetical protein
MQRATLIEDAGAASAAPAHFVRSPQFLAAEAVTHTLSIDGDRLELRLPVIVREIEGSGLRDAISPYGCPGADCVPAAPPAPGEVDWSQTGLVSLFVRDRLGDPCLAGGTVRAEVRIADPRTPSGMRKRLREQIRRNERRGWTVAAEPGTEAAPEDRRAFAHAYTETMRRTQAAERYLYDDAYIERVLAAESSWLLLAGRDGAPPGAGAIAVASDHHLHYYLGGTADAALTDSPMKNLFAAMISLAGELGLPLSLGGGVTPGDSLDQFKRGFANGTAPFHTHEVVCDPQSYGELSAGAEVRSGGFFPAYRAPG